MKYSFYFLHTRRVNLLCTHYSNLSGRPDIFLGSGTLKKQGPKYGVQKAGCKKQGHCYSKREEAAALFSFWIIMTLFFAPCFLHPIFLTWFFSGSQTDPCFQNKNSGDRLTGQQTKISSGREQMWGSQKVQNNASNNLPCVNFKFSKIKIDKPATY